MVRTPSQMLPLGTRAPAFSLLDTNGQRHELGPSAPGSLVLVMFICNHCPYVQHLLPRLVECTREWVKLGVSIYAINSNDVEAYPADSPVEMAKLAKDLKFPFPYLFDETQAVAKAFHAACTPDFFLFDGSLELIYRGQFDDSRPSNREPVTGQDLDRAIQAGLRGQIIPDRDQAASLGCNIKWKQRL